VRRLPAVLVAGGPVGRAASTSDSLDPAVGPAGRCRTVVPVLPGACPKAIDRVGVRDRSAFKAAMRSLASGADHRALAGRFAVRRDFSGFRA
jgi:hypothetical protein